ncbi:hypothetical protein [Vibrio crassostreae]|uniref:hypothetical protein n=1 Tax=Vibrio crassostreae TaxID=246167 RepID=UPI001B30498E|nr:hypothetical protein [Vibrio crassostreae]
MKRLITTLLLVFSVTAQANCDLAVKNISDETVKNTTLIACMKAEKEAIAHSEDITEAAIGVLAEPDKLEELAHSYSSAIGIMAKDLGVAANEFIDTEAGQLAVYAIIYTVFGEDIKGFFMTPLICLLLMFMWRKFNDVNLRGQNEQYPSFSDMSDGEATWFLISSVASFVAIVYVLVTGWL